MTLRQFLTKRRNDRINTEVSYLSWRSMDTLVIVNSKSGRWSIKVHDKSDWKYLFLKAKGQR